MPDEPQSPFTPQAAALLSRVVRSFGYDIVETSLIQPAELFMTRAGDEIADHLFTFERGGQTLVLRPEFTSAALQQYIAAYPHGDQVQRWAYAGAIFNDADDGTPYQQTSVGAELIGMADSFADAEILAMAMLACDALKIPGARLIVGSVALTRQAIAGFGLDNRAQQLLMSHLHQVEGAPHTAEALSVWVSKLLQTSSGDHTSPENGASAEQTARTIQALIGSQQSPVTGSRSREEILARLLQKRQRAASNTEYQLLISFLERWMAISSGLDDAETAISAHLGPRTAEFAPLASRFLAPVRLLNSYGIEADRILVRPALSRSWEYYSDLVFEVRAGNGDLLAAGGRYDTFAALLGASTQVPAVGVAFFVDTMARHAGVVPEAASRPLTVTAANLVDALPAAMILRQHGQDVRVLEDKMVSIGPGVIRVEAGRLIHDSTNYSLKEIDQLLLAKGRLE